MEWIALELKYESSALDREKSVSTSLIRPSPA